MTAREAELEDPHTCPRCGGGGEVTWNPSVRNDPQCEESATCPVCRGHGEVDADELEEAEPDEPDYDRINDDRWIEERL
jgi:DnaJ-class molecular chaperone